jgi:hypothetical protein
MCTCMHSMYMNVYVYMIICTQIYMYTYMHMHHIYNNQSFTNIIKGNIDD